MRGLNNEFIYVSIYNKNKQLYVYYNFILKKKKKK